MFGVKRSSRGSMHDFLISPPFSVVFITLQTLLNRSRLAQEGLSRSDANVIPLFRALLRLQIAITHLSSLWPSWALLVYMSVKIFSVRSNFVVRMTFHLQDWSLLVGPYNSYRRQNCQSALYQQFYRKIRTRQEAACLSIPSTAWSITMCQWVLCLPEVRS